jgi:hypothetical protein
MALVLPVAGAAVGGFFGGNTGAAAGWMIGSWMSTFFMDSDDDNKVFDPGAEEMPRINQALRGVTIPVTFGTNRVSSNIVWRNDFQAIRHESSQGGGGGKGGGSGMGAKGGGPESTQVTYEYKLDMLLHCIMSDEDVSLFGGWLGSERLNSETLLAIINNTTALGSFFRSDVDRPQNAALSFEEGFFHGASATDDDNADNWGHFETTEGQPFRFPYTSYIGFKQLNLGGSARMPQLTWEIGPGNVDLDFNSNHIDIWDGHSAVSPTGGTGPAAGIVKDANGVRYQIDFAAGNTMLRIRDVDNGVTTDTMTDTEFDAEATAIGLDPGTAYDFTARIFGNVIPGTDYVLCGGQDIGLASRSNYAFVLFEVGTDGLLNAVGGYQGRTNSLEGPNTGMPIIGIYGEGNNDDAILMMCGSQVSSDEEYFLWRLPTITEMLAVLLEDTASNNFQTRQSSLETAVTEIQANFGHHSSARTYLDRSFGFMLPVVSALGVFSTKLMFFIGKSDIEWHNDNPADSAGTQTIYDITGTHPNGGIFSVGVATSGTHGMTIDSAWSDEAANYIDRISGDSVLPFPDSGFLYDETTVQDVTDYDPNPQFQHIRSGAAAGATLLVFWKNVGRTSADRDPNDNSTRAKIFIWNPLTQKATLYADQIGAFADPSTDWGFGSSYNIDSISGYWDEATNELLIGAYIDDFAASDDLVVSKFGDFELGGGEDVLPPYIIRKILTSPVFGIGISDSQIDDTSYNLAIQYCDGEDIRVSVQYKREENVLRILYDLLALYNGFLIDSGGQIKFGLQTFTTSPVRTIDNDHLLITKEGQAPVSVSVSARQDGFNKVKVNYFDRDLEYRQNQIEISDEVDIDQNGVRAQEFPAKFVMKEALANKIAVRALWSNLYARNMYDFSLGAKDADLEPGDVVTLVDSFHPALQAGKQVRITQWSERDPLMFTVRAVDEVEYVSVSTLAVQSTSEQTYNTLFGPALPAADFTMYELPAEFQGATAKTYVGYRQQSNTKGARLYVSADGTSFAQVQEVQPYIISGIMAGPLVDRAPGYVEENIQVYLMPDTATTAFNANTPTYAQTFQLDDVSQTGRALGAGLFWINSEMLAYEDATLLAQNHYRLGKVFRGWGGTHIQAHGSGDSWHKHGGGIFTQDFNEDKIGTIIHYKVAPFNFSGVEFDIASVDARTYQIQGTFFRPQVQAPIRTFVQSPGSFLTIQSEDLGPAIRKKAVIAGGSDVVFEWPDQARKRGYGARGYGDGGYGRFESDTQSVNWRVEVLSNDLTTVVRCTTVDTMAYEYTHLVNSEDWNGWNGDFALKVTPFNEFGDALRSRTKILELFL